MLLNNSTSQTESPLNYPTLGIIGCGNIGKRQAANFLAHGYSVYVYDINPARMAQLQSLGAHITHSCAELATHCEVIFTALPTPSDTIKAVLEGEQNLSQGLRSGSIYIDITTNSPETIHRLHQAISPLGVEMLDVPFNDCSEGATSEGGMGLAVLASGSRATFERVEPLLQLMADQVLYCGEIGSGTRCKLIHNAVNAVAVQAVSEGITLGLAQGISLETIWDTLRFGSFGQNPGDIHGLPYYWFSRRCDHLSKPPAFTVKLLHKDLRIALDMAIKNDISVSHLNLTIKDYEEAERRGWSPYATTKVRCLQEERAGVIAKVDQPILSTPSPTKASGTSKNRFSLYSVLMLVLVSNLFQLGLQWLFHSHNLF
ncbi:NAD(P)-dependent oxidoreductase [Lyngbya sp. PCC 8106]|uniref:NAD(P)-dependent oxidoreductase n=1 Tax=Lyngbya sp. (strain PCC 8106) TaxID=313612 RepID=UPI0000EAD55A|nr:NAD(P)-dependent oxidoreductase [Lyngbya sp. PCC 8106]EAW37594.1 3-hydroxyisobutyrate dehydrogenase [Lyngbya sp. PCC 8106]